MNRIKKAYSKYNLYIQPSTVTGIHGLAGGGLPPLKLSTQFYANDTWTFSSVGEPQGNKLLYICTMQYDASTEKYICGHVFRTMKNSIIEYEVEKTTVVFIVLTLLM